MLPLPFYIRMVSPGGSYQRLVFWNLGVFISSLGGVGAFHYAVQSTASPPLILGVCMCLGIFTLVLGVWVHSAVLFGRRQHLDSVVGECKLLNSQERHG